MLSFIHGDWRLSHLIFFYLEYNFYRYLVRSHSKVQLLHQSNDFKCFIPIKSGYWFFDIFTICLAVTPYNLEDIFCLRLQKTSSRRLQDLLIKINIFVLVTHLQAVFKIFSRRLQDIFKTSCQDVLQRRLQKSSRSLQDVLQERLQDIFKTFLRRLRDVFETSSRHLAKASLRHLAKISSTHL